MAFHFNECKYIKLSSLHCKALIQWPTMRRTLAPFQWPARRKRRYMGALLLIGRELICSFFTPQMLILVTLSSSTWAHLYLAKNGRYGSIGTHLTSAAGLRSAGYSPNQYVVPVSNDRTYYGYSPIRDFGNIAPPLIGFRSNRHGANADGYGWTENAANYAHGSAALHDTYGWNGNAESVFNRNVGNLNYGSTGFQGISPGYSGPVHGNYGGAQNLHSVFHSNFNPQLQTSSSYYSGPIVNAENTGFGPTSITYGNQDATRSSADFFNSVPLGFTAYPYSQNSNSQSATSGLASSLKNTHNQVTTLPLSDLVSPGLTLSASGAYTKNFNGQFSTTSLSGPVSGSHGLTQSLQSPTLGSLKALQSGYSQAAPAISISGTSSLTGLTGQGGIPYVQSTGQLSAIKSSGLPTATYDSNYGVQVSTYDYTGLQQNAHRQPISGISSLGSISSAQLSGQGGVPYVQNTDQLSTIKSSGSPTASYDSSLGIKGSTSGSLDLFQKSYGRPTIDLLSSLKGLSGQGGLPQAQSYGQLSTIKSSELSPATYDYNVGVQGSTSGPLDSLQHSYNQFLPGFSSSSTSSLTGLSGQSGLPYVSNTDQLPAIKPSGLLGSPSSSSSSSPTSSSSSAFSAALPTSYDQNDKAQFPKASISSSVKNFDRKKNDLVTSSYSSSY